MHKYISVVVAVLILFASCKKTPTTKNTTTTTACTSTLYGYIGTIAGSTGNCSFGIIDQSKYALSTLATFSSSVYSNQVAFNMGDSCYYAFKTPMLSAVSQSPLYKISAAGTVTSLTNSGASGYTSLTYNAVTNKLYCFSNGYLAEITTGASAFSTTAVVAPIHGIPFDSTDIYDPLAVDNTTGDMYYVTGDTGRYFLSDTFYIEQYHPGSSASKMVATGTANTLGILGLCFNKNDHMLYALRLGITTDFIKIDPATDSITKLSSLSFYVNRNAYSAVIDPCSNQYILSTLPTSSGLNIIAQLSMSGTVVQQDTTASFFQGLSVK